MQRGSPDADAVRKFFSRARNYARLHGALGGATAGLSISFLIGLYVRFFVSPAASPAQTTWLGFVLAVAIVTAIVGVLSSRTGLVDVGRAVEKDTPASRNVIATAAELLDGRIRSVPYIADRIFSDVAALAGNIDVSRVFPVRWTALMCASLLSFNVTTIEPWRSPAAGRGTPASSPAAATIARVDVQITPPDYAAQPARALRDPTLIEALAGSRLTFTIAADAASLTIETLTGSQTLTSAGGPYSATILADADGYVALHPTAANGVAGVRRLIGLSVTPDAAPRVRITSPGKDLFFESGRRSLPVAVEAEDDLALAALEVRYTRIAGSGENFTFTTGVVPMRITGNSGRAWTALGTWELGALALEPGDMVIYRGVATDRRPGAPPAESDTFIVEITAPGALPSEGFAIDDRQDKYAISQQMVIVKTERLLATRASISPEELRDRALDLAAEQRQVRAEFVFMMGGELADAGLDVTSLSEEVEAAGEEDLAAGRLVNQGRLDLVRAIRFMSRAAARLGDLDAGAALPFEKDALASLQRAFSRSRYILRALATRERIDLSRRLTGVLAALAGDRRPAVETSLPPRVEALRRALGAVAALASDAVSKGKESTAAQAAAIAQRLLHIDPASAELREIASTLMRVDLDRAATALAALARRELPASPGPPMPADLVRLAGALADAQRRTGGLR